jgi:hypothetical protein
MRGAHSRTRESITIAARGGRRVGILGRRRQELAIAYYDRPPVLLIGFAPLLPERNEKKGKRCAWGRTARERTSAPPPSWHLPALDLRVARAEETRVIRGVIEL